MSLTFQDGLKLQNKLPMGISRSSLRQTVRFLRRWMEEFRRLSWSLRISDFADAGRRPCGLRILLLTRLPTRAQIVVPGLAAKKKYDSPQFAPTPLASEPDSDGHNDDWQSAEDFSKRFEKRRPRPCPLTVAFRDADSYQS